jgi:FolB domain-containing protein
MTPGMPPCCRWDLDGDVESVQFARDRIAEILQQWNLDAWRDDAVLVTSELVTNALRHGRPPRAIAIWLVIGPYCVPAAVCIDVGDAERAWPIRREGGADGGFGLVVAEALATITVHPRAGGKVVRAYLLLDAAGEAAMTGWPDTRAAHTWPRLPAAADVAEQTIREGHIVDLIDIDALRLRCVIGVRAEERRDRSDVVIDLRIGADTRAAAATDDVADAWNYRTPVKQVISCVEESACFTVEALATRIARLLVIDHEAPYVRVAVRKPGALRFADSVGVVIERTPADFAREVPAS